MFSPLFPLRKYGKFSPPFFPPPRFFPFPPLFLFGVCQEYEMRRCIKRVDPPSPSSLPTYNSYFLFFPSFFDSCERKNLKDRYDFFLPPSKLVPLQLSLPPKNVPLPPSPFPLSSPFLHIEKRSGLASPFFSLPFTISKRTLLLSLPFNQNRKKRIEIMYTTSFLFSPPKGYELPFFSHEVIPPLPSEGDRAPSAACKI